MDTRRLSVLGLILGIASIGGITIAVGSAPPPSSPDSRCRTRRARRTPGPDPRT